MEGLYQTETEENKRLKRKEVSKTEAFLQE